MILNKSLNQIQEAPIVKLKKLAQPLRKTKDFIDLSQAVPAYPPPPEIINFFKHIDKTAQKEKIHFYTQDEGLLSLRKTISFKLKRFNNIDSTPFNVIITSGANQAYLLSLMCLLNKGDEVILTEPYYFNHKMAVELCNATPVTVNLDESNEFDIDPKTILDKVSSKTRIITLVSPNNPTGKTLSYEKLKYLAKNLKKKNIIIISDETYEYFSKASGERHFSIGSIKEIASKVFTISTFSKTFSLSGWRVGYLNAPEEYIPELLKIQDTMIICPNHAAQIAAEIGLKKSLSWLEEKIKSLSIKLKFIKKFNFSATKFKLASVGGFFAYIKHDFDCEAWEVCEQLLKSAHILVLPGTIFGKNQDNFIRIAVGAVELPALRKAFNKLKNFHLQTLK